MKINESEINLIKSSFENMNSEEDFLTILNRIKPLVYGKKSIPFELKRIKFFTQPKTVGRNYKEFKIRKKSGGERSIHSPGSGLKSVQKALSILLQCVFEPHPAAMGFVSNKSILDNGKLHEGSNYVFNIDLKDFFSSIDQARVWKCLQLKPFNLNGNRLIFANMIASICCTEMEVERKNKSGEWELLKKNVLPQGAPTSPVITNIICQRLDFILTGVAKKFGLKYSRYADDITFSSSHNVYQAESDFVKEIRRVIEEQRFNINESKTRLQRSGGRKEVTGLVVNEKVNVHKKYVKEIRMWLYFWERYGYKRVYEIFISRRLPQAKGLLEKHPNFLVFILGKLNYLKMVKGYENEMFLKLNSKFNSLIEKDTKKGENIKEKQIITEPIEVINYDTELKFQFSKSSEISKVHNPKKVLEWLRIFSKHGSYIKFSTHMWDEDLFNTYDSFVTGLNHDFNTYQINDLQNFSSNLYWEKIYPFLFQDSLTEIQRSRKINYGWGKHKIKIGWQFPNTIKKWCELNFDDKDKNVSFPFSMEIPNDLLPNKLIGGKTIKYFEDIVNLFKDEIEFRDNKLFIGIKTLCKEIIPNHSLDLQLLDSLRGNTFYSNTEYVLKAVSVMLNMVRSRPEKLKVAVKSNFDEIWNGYTLEILHLDSYSDIELTHPKLMILDNYGELAKLRTILTSLCDFAIESRFKDNTGALIFKRIEYLYDGVESLNWQPKISEAECPEEGFKFILKFPVV